MIGQGFGGGFQNGQALQGTIYPASYVETLERRKTDLESKLAEVTEALDALRKNPELERVLSLLTRAAQNW